MLSQSHEFNRIKAIMTRTLRSAQTAPAFVFATNYHVMAFVEFDQGLTAKFWRFIQSLGSTAADPNIFVVAIEPDAEQYFYKEFGKYGAFQLTVDDTADAYLERLGEHPEGWPVDSLKYNSECLAWTSDSGRWVAWGNRGYSYIAIAFESRFLPNLGDLAKRANINLFSKESAISDLILPSFQDSVAAQSFVNEFRRNY